MSAAIQIGTMNASKSVPSQGTFSPTLKLGWNLLTIPPELVLRILAYLDIPDLASLSQASPQLGVLTSDPILHRDRLRLTAPSRVAHSLFGTGPSGILLRPGVGELLQRGIMKGLGIERQWRTGGYLYSPRTISVYEKALRLHRLHAQNLISAVLRDRLVSPRLVTDGLKKTKPGVISRALLPTIRSLGWSFKRDQVSRVVRGASGIGVLFAKREVGVCETLGSSNRGVAMWIERQGPKLIPDSTSGLEVERTRLALCPGVGGIIRFYEGLSVDD